MPAEHGVRDVHAGFDRLLGPDAGPTGIAADEEQAADRCFDRRLARTALPDDLSARYDSDAEDPDRPLVLLGAGQLLTLFRVGEYVKTTTLGKIMNFHLAKYMPRIFTGEASRSRYSIELVSFMSEYGLAGNDPELLRIN